MKFTTLLFSLLISTLTFSNQAFAHTDHALGEGSIHALYHAIFWGVFFLVIYKIHAWHKGNTAKNKK